MAKKKKLVITETIKEIYIDSTDLDGDIDRVITRLRQIAEKAKSLDYRNVRIDIFSYEGVDISVSGTRDETDKELTDRLDKEEKKNKEKRDKELAEYKRLKAIFG